MNTVQRNVVAFDEVKLNEAVLTFLNAFDETQDFHGKSTEQEEALKRVLQVLVVHKSPSLDEAVAAVSHLQRVPEVPGSVTQKQDNKKNKNLLELEK